jgi:hypothetical protein
MIILTDDTAVDLGSVTGMMKVHDRLTLFGQSNNMPSIKGQENQLMVAFFFRKPAISADDILRLADQITVLRSTAYQTQELAAVGAESDFRWPQE